LHRGNRPLAQTTDAQLVGQLCTLLLSAEVVEDQWRLLSLGYVIIQAVQKFGDFIPDWSNSVFARLAHGIRRHSPKRIGIGNIQRVDYSARGGWPHWEWLVLWPLPADADRCLKRADQIVDSAQPLATSYVLTRLALASSRCGEFLFRLEPVALVVAGRTASLLPFFIG
jgi:hypothetical protein